LSARTVLEARNVSKTFAAGPALCSFDLTVRAGQIHGLVGENGSGKSTFIKILAGYHEADPGARITLAGRELSHASGQSAYALGCRFVHQDLGLIDELTIADNLSLATGFPTQYGSIRSGRLFAAARDALNQAGLDLPPRALVGELSPATKTGVAIARALRESSARRAQLIVMDEPTATLPAPEVQHLLRMLRTVADAGVGVLYVSHRLEEILALCDEVTVLRDGTKVGTHPVAGLSRQQIITLMIGDRAMEIEENAAAQHRKHGQSADASTNVPALRVQGISSPEVVDFNLIAHRGTITGIAGITGSGRETILNAIFGGAERFTGQVSVAGERVTPATPHCSIRSGIGYLPPDRNRLGAASGLPARENLTLLHLKPFRRFFTLLGNPEKAEVRRWFERLQIRPQEPNRTFSTFSGGNQQKIIFAKWMRTQPVVLLLDEPTQGVDVGAKALLHQAVVGFAAAGGTVVVSSSDSDELLTLCDRILVMRDGRVAEELSGNRLNVHTLARECLGSDSEASAS
jgi:ribose transport system ATP-binding protein